MDTFLCGAVLSIVSTSRSGSTTAMLMGELALVSLDAGR